MGNFVTGMSSSKQGERIRQQNIASGKNDVLHRRYGKIVTIHPEFQAMVRVLYDDEVTFAAGGAFLPVEEPTLIEMKWGKLRKNMKVVVEYSGDAENAPTVRVLSDETQTTETHEFSVPSNEIETGIFEIFPPGVTSI